MHGSASRKFVLVPALVAVVLLALAPVASAKEDPSPPPTTASTAPPTTIADEGPPPSKAGEAPPTTTVAEEPGDAGVEAAKTEEPVPTTSVPTTIVVDPIGPLGPLGPITPPPAELPPPQPNPRIALTPNVDLQHLQTVQVSGTGFTPNVSVGAAQCRTGGTDASDCDIRQPIITTTDGDGAWSGSLVVGARIPAGGEIVDCTEPGACGVGAARMPDNLEIAGATLVFDPNTPVPPPPSVSVTPSTDLVHDQQVTVSASGFAPNDNVRITECADTGDPYPPCSSFNGPLFPQVTDANGDLSAPFTVQRFLGGQGAALVDCAEVKNCYIQVSSFSDQLATGTAPISFDPDAPLPPRPTVSVSPSSDLVQHQQVTLSGSGFSPNEGVQISQCSVTSNPYPVCSYSSGVIVGPFQPPVDGDGTLSATFQVRRLLGYPDDVVVDCAEAPGCVMRVFSYADILHSVDVPISFDPDVPLPPPPSLTIEPETDLVHDEELTVSGSGFLPNDFLDLSECLTDANGVTQACVYSTTGLVESDASGEFTTTFIAKRVLGYPGQPLLDCVEAAECALYARSYSDPFASGEVELHFDPDAPLPPPPTLTVEPSTDLPARQTVNVKGSGFAPNTSHNVVQCSGDSSFFDFRCNFGPSVLSDEHGNIDTQFTARRYIQNFPEPIDCAEPDRCVVAVFSYADPLSVAFVPVSFDPNAPPPPQPTITVTPTDGLADGASVSITGKDFSPGGIVAISQCRGDASLVCDSSIIKFLTAGEDGTIATDYLVHAGILVPDGIVGCETAPGACSIQAATAGEVGEVTPAVLLTFGAKVADAPVGVGGGDSPAPVRVTRAPRLAFTGTPVAGYLEFGAISLGLGALLVIAGRMRRIRA